MNDISGQTSVNIDKNAWFICDSRSHPGLKYYVHKVTGVKVWNITESEIAMAEKVDKFGPEPDGSPTMNIPTDQTAIHNKTVINNQFSNQLSNVVLNSDPFSPGNSYSSWDNQHSPPVNLQQQLFNARSQAVNMQPQPFISQDQNINLHQQIFNSQGQLVNMQQQPYISQEQSVNLHQQLFNSQGQPVHLQQQLYNSQGQPVNLQRHFTTFTIVPSPSSHNQASSYQYPLCKQQSSNFHEEAPSVLNKVCEQNQTEGDLRRRIIKRRKSCSGRLDYDDVDYQCEKRPKCRMKNRIEPESAPLQPLNLALLKSVTSRNFQSNRWFIVVEIKIILENYPFLDDMVIADPDCYLVVPHHVLSELNMHVAINSDVRPRRIMRFLNQQIKNGMVTIGEQVEGHDSSHKTILTCLKLNTGNNVVILIGSSTRTLNFKSNKKGIHVFTMQNVKDILENKSTNANTPSPRMTGVKIVIANNLKRRNSNTRETGISSELFDHYYNQTENNDQLYTPPLPATKNGKISSRIIDMPTKPSMQPVSAIISPETERKIVSLEETLILGENLPSSSKINVNNPHKRVPNVPLMSSTPITKAVPCNNSVVDKEDELSRTHTSTLDNSTEANKYSPKEPEFASPRKMYHSNWNPYGNKNKRHTMDTRSTSSTSNNATKAVPCNNNAADEEDELSRRRSATYIASTDPTNTNFQHTSTIKKPSDNSTEANKYSLKEPEFASPRKMYHPNWNHYGNKNKRHTIDTSSTSSTSNNATKALPCNNNAVDEEDELSRRRSATYITSTDPNNSNFHHTSTLDNSTEANKYSPKEPEFASPRKMYHSNWNPYGNKNKRHTMDTRSTSSTSNNATKAVPCNNNAADEEDELSRRRSATYIASIDPNNSNFHHTSTIKKPSGSMEASKFSPMKPEFASPRKMYDPDGNDNGNKNKRDTMDDTISSSSTCISLDTIKIKEIISMKNLISATSTGQIDNAKEITTPIEKPKSSSSWASYDNDNTSDTSLKKTVRRNRATEETSTSGVISNSDSFNSDKVINPKKQDVRKVSRKRSIVMYDVACLSMEEVLRLRSEEWVFRFVQIMEEVLRVKLQEKVPHEQKEPAPWNLQEAARCIIKKFDSHFDVVDAANKLSRFLYESSDEKGKIINIEPSDYMELYSYGVFLVETFLDMTCIECEDKDEKRSFIEEKCSCHEVETAFELLKKLLFDIQNANVETFADNPPDFLLNSSVDDNTHYNFNMERHQSSAETVKTKMGEMESAENVKRYPVKRKQTNTLDEVTPKVKVPASSNLQRFTKKVDNAAKADEAGKMCKKTFFKHLQLGEHVDNNKKNTSLSKEADVQIPPKVRNVMMGTSSNSAFLSSLQFLKKDLNNAEKLKACNITVQCSNKTDAPDEQKDPRNTPEQLMGLKCHFSNEDNLPEISPSKVVCNFKINEDIERKVNANRYRRWNEDSESEVNMAGQYETQDRIRSVPNTLGIDDETANETFETIPVENHHKRTIIGNHMSLDNKVHENEKISKDEAIAKFQLDDKDPLWFHLIRVLARVILLYKTYIDEKIKQPSAECTVQSQTKVKYAVKLVFSMLKNLKEDFRTIRPGDNFKNHFQTLRQVLELENTEDYFPTDDGFDLQYRNVVLKCVQILKILLNIVERRNLEI